jgi:DNA-binding LacI/PurR family transcriptional regulator
MIYPRKQLTRKDIAEAAGVSPATVSRALSGSPLLPQATIERIRKVARRMGYRPNELARRLAANRSGQVGFVVPPVTDRGGPFHLSYYSRLLDAVTQTAFARGHTVTILPGLEKPGDAGRLARHVESRQVDGLLFLGLRVDQTDLRPLRRQGLACVVVGAEPTGARPVSVNCDPGPGIREMLAALRERKCKRLFFAHGDLAFHDARRQLSTLEEETVAGPPLARVFAGNYSFRSGYGLAADVLAASRAGDAVFLANDRMAAGFYRWCQERGIAIPGRIRVVGSDDDYSASLLFPSLSTIHQPRTEMGVAAADLLIDLIEGKTVRPTRLPTHFVARESI